MSNLYNSSSNTNTGYYGYNSETRNIKNKKKKKSGSPIIFILGIVLALVQICLSVYTIISLINHDMSNVTKVAAIILIILLILTLVLLFAKTSVTKKISMGLSSVVSILLLVFIIILLPRFSAWGIGEKVDEDPFIVFVSASDTFGSFNEDVNERSDTNIIAVVNPKTYTVLMITTPRDYYVPIFADSVAPNSMDKLTHVSLYGNGIAYDSDNHRLSSSDWGWAQEVVTQGGHWGAGNDSIMNTLKELYSLDIDENHYHYVKLNFTGFAHLVDSLGGVTVDVDVPFTARTYATYDEIDSSRQTYTFTEGEMEMDGNTALTFARERKSFGSGDMQRNKNQAKVLKAISNKLLSPSILKNPNKVLDSIDDCFTTDMSINSLINLQTGLSLKSDYNGWNIISFGVVGNSGTDTLTWNGLPKSVVFQDADSIARAKDLINMTMGGSSSKEIENKVDEYNKEQ